MAIFWTTPDQSISLRARAIGIAVINATGNIGSALSPFMIGWLKDLTGSFNSGLWFVAALLVGACVSAACVILLKAFAKKKPTNVATDDELDLDFEIN